MKLTLLLKMCAVVCFVGSGLRGAVGEAAGGCSGAGSSFPDADAIEAVMAPIEASINLRVAQSQLVACDGQVLACKALLGDAQHNLDMLLGTCHGQRAREEVDYAIVVAEKDLAAAQAARTAASLHVAKLRRSNKRCRKADASQESDVSTPVGPLLQRSARVLVVRRPVPLTLKRT